ncbi:glucose and ribitol dehydrogenase-like protein, partial [Trifolium pratense]
GKVALVTGGDSGIGRAVCLIFAKEGATVAFTYVKGVEDRDKDDTLKMLLEAKTSDAQEPLAIAADIGYDEDCKQVVEFVVKEYGHIDILVNNAAEQHLKNSIEDITEQQLERVFRTNIFSHFFLVRHALKHMKEGSSIINSTSVNAYTGKAETLDYTSTKGAIVAFTRGLAQQLVNRGIRVNAVAPGPVWTPVQPATMPAEMIQNLGSDVPMKRAGQPCEIAPCYLFLASLQDSSYFTGQVLHPNGGMIVNA